ncbi:MerR family transcriptional regulator [Nesterenkonia muleiensis]|uniref:MerR family transcriptional regulator n=1 Tax=Nesterenkonia muleiensis TaxID=2282648 RepID=UPI000E76571C|nr:MerR family transcriptional regulator [Nesterenkonia muleiensis]
MTVMDDDEELLTIGEIARASGLSISALRFYDRQGVFPPRHVDPVSGYRWYARSQLSDAKLLARLRRIGLPLPEIATILTRADADLTRTVLEEHIDGLEAGLAVARSEVSTLGRELGVEIPPAAAGQERFRASLSSTDLLAGLRTVRHAVGDDPDLPSIHGIHLVVVNRGLRLSATDRHRAAFAEVPAKSTGRLRALLATADADQLLELGKAYPRAQVLLADRHLTLVDSAGDCVLGAQLLETTFPDLSHAIPVVRESALITAEELIEVLNEHPSTGLWALHRSSLGGNDGDLHCGPESAAQDSPGAIYVDRTYLEDALAGLTSTQGTAQLRFDVDGPADPVAIRRAEELGTFVVILPVIPGCRR